MANQIVPLSPQPGQAFSVSLTVDGKILPLQLRTRFNEIANYWVLTVLDRFSNLLVDSIPLVASDYPAANLLQQQVYLAIGSAYLGNVNGTTAEFPGPTNLGTDFVLVWGDTPLV